MSELVSASIPDLATVASWIHSAELCHQWAGVRVRFPIQVGLLATEIEFRIADSWCLAENEQVVAFGQIIPKAESRLHLARLIVSPMYRGRGLGRALAGQLLERALARSPERVSLNVFPDNVAAVALYRSLGFRRIERPASELESTSHYMERAV